MQGRTFIGGRHFFSPVNEAAGVGEGAIRWNMLGKTVVCLLRRWRLGGAWHDGDLHGTTEGVTHGVPWGARGAGTAQEQADTAACCGGGGLASDGVLVPGTRTGVDACAAKQG